MDEWLEEAPYSALRILKKLREMGFTGGCSIVKAYVGSRKMDLNEKAAVRFETMPGKQGKMDWGFFEDHLVYYEHEYPHSAPSERVSVLWYETSGHQAAAETGGLHAEPAV